MSPFVEGLTGIRLAGFLFLASFIIVFLLTPAYGRDFRVKKKLKDYTLSVTLPRNPPILGKNDIMVEIKDVHGNEVTGASVTINYFMPPMPGMPPMNYRVKAPPAGSKYKATMDLIMKGPWNIAIRTKVAGKRLRMTVLIDVR